MPQTPPVIDAIDRQIDIQATPERVYELVSRPGWWINEGAITDNRIASDGDVSTVTHAKYGEFRIRTVDADPPRYVSFRWLGGEPENEGKDVPGTLVEFFVTANAAGGATLRVTESGFTTLPGTDEQRRKNYDDNSIGWNQELEAAKTHVEAA